MDGNCGCARHLPGGVSRRDLLRSGAAAAGILALGPLGRFLPTASGTPLDQTRFVVLNLFGGNDTLNMFVPVNLQPYYDRRPGLALLPGETLSLATGPGATAAYRLHPAMPRLAALWAEGSVAAVNRVGYPDANLSHFTSMDIFSLGVRNGFGGLGVPESGWLARYADLYAATPMGAVAVGVGRPLDFAGGTSNPFLVNDLASFRLTLNQGSPAQVYRLEVAKQILAGFSGTGVSADARNALSQAHDLADQVQAALAAYTTSATFGSSYIGQRMRDVAVLVQAGFETRVFYAGTGGYDTHGGQGTASGYHAALLGQVDQAVGAFAQDMKDRGVWNKTVIAIITEFGRRNYVNGSAGTDHGHGFCELLVGGAVKGGTYGPGLVEADINAEYPSYAVDFRAIYKEVLGNHLGADPAPVFPEPLEIDTTLGLIA